jgi:PAS domain S-box-containing protein
MKNINKSQIPSLKQNYEDLSEIGNKYLEFMEFARDVIFILSPVGLVIEVNNTFIDITGWQNTECIGKSITYLIDPEDIPLAKERFANLLSGKVAQSIDVRIRKKNGDYIICELLASPKIIEGKVIKILVIGRDITSRKMVNKALLESEERFRAIALNTPDHILVHDLNLRYKFVINPQLGLTQEDMIGKTDIDILPLEEAENLMNLKKKIMKEGQPFHLETFLTNIKGDKEFFEGYYIPIFESNGQVNGLIGYFRNVTKVKVIEEELQRWHEVTLGREDRIFELKQEVNELLRQAGKPTRYEHT